MLRYAHSIPGLQPLYLSSSGFPVFACHSFPKRRYRCFFGTTDTDFSFDPQWLVENTKVGIPVLRIVRPAAQIFANSGGLVKLLELLLEHGADDIRN
jgi:hypothetical protein